MDIWNELHHLFDEDDGSLPDIFVEGISAEESVEIYSWVLSLTKPYGEPCLWSIEEERDIRITDIPNPALYYTQGKAESFRHGLEKFSFSEVEIPQLSICIGESSVEFDYRMGKEWGSKELLALFEFLYRIKCIAPKAKIVQAYEGGYDNPNQEFSNVFEAYANEYSNS